MASGVAFIPLYDLLTQEAGKPMAIYAVTKVEDFKANFELQENLIGEGKPKLSIDFNPMKGDQPVIGQRWLVSVDKTVCPWTALLQFAWPTIEKTLKKSKSKEDWQILLNSLKADDEIWLQSNFPGQTSGLRSETPLELTVSPKQVQLKKLDLSQETDESEEWGHALKIKMTNRSKKPLVLWLNPYMVKICDFGATEEFSYKPATSPLQRIRLAQPTAADLKRLNPNESFTIDYTLSVIKNKTHLTLPLVSNYQQYHEWTRAFETITKASFDLPITLCFQSARPQAQDPIRKFLKKDEEIESFIAYAPSIDTALNLSDKAAINIYSINGKTVSQDDFQVFLKSLTEVKGTRRSWEGPKGHHSSYEARGKQGEYLIKVEGTATSAYSTDL